MKRCGRQTEAPHPNPLLGEEREKKSQKLPFP
jgi:hypothetical protein